MKYVAAVFCGLGWQAFVIWHAAFVIPVAVVLAFATLDLILRDLPRG